MESAGVDSVDSQESPPPPPCDWARQPRLHWSVAIPWLLADPALSTGINDDGGAYIVGVTAEDGTFGIAISPPSGAFLQMGMVGSFDPLTGSGSWTLPWIDQGCKGAWSSADGTTWNCQGEGS